MPKTVKKVPIGEIAQVNLGFTFREKISPQDCGIFVLQLKDMKQDGSLDLSNLDMIENAGFKENVLLAENDIVFRSRGGLFLAGVVPHHLQKMVLSAPFIKLSVDFTRVLPAYLCLLINSSAGQTYLQSKMLGSAIQTISKATLLEMKVLLPPPGEQKKVLELVELQQKEAAILGTILKKRQQIINASIRRFVSF